MIGHIHPTKQLRVCTMCHSSLSRTEAEAQELSRLRGNSTGKTGSDDDEVEGSSEEEEAEEQMENHEPSRLTDSWCPYVYFEPEHVRLQT